MMEFEIMSYWKRVLCFVATYFAFVIFCVSVNTKITDWGIIWHIPVWIIGWWGIPALITKLKK